VRPALGSPRRCRSPGSLQIDGWEPRSASTVGMILPAVPVESGLTTPSPVAKGPPFRYYGASATRKHGLDETKASVAVKLKRGTCGYFPLGLLGSIGTGRSAVGGFMVPISSTLPGPDD
jgi:hypothetical protein